MEEKPEGMMPGEKDLGRPHHREPEVQPGKLSGEVEKGERGFATINEFKESLEGLPEEVVKHANLLRRGLRLALTEEDKKKLGDVLRETGKLVAREPRLERWSALMEQEVTGEVKPGEPSEARKEQGKEEKRLPATESLGKIRPETEGNEGVIEEPMPEQFRRIEKGLSPPPGSSRPPAVVGDEYLSFLGAIRARGPVPGEGISDDEWKKIGLYNAELNTVVKRSKDDEEKKEAKRLQELGSALVHEMHFYYTYWYAGEEGIGKSVRKSKEGSRCLLVKQIGELLKNEDFEKAFKAGRGYRSDDQLIDLEKDPWCLRVAAHHCRRYLGLSMGYDAYEQAVKTKSTLLKKEWQVAGRPVRFVIYKPAPGSGKSFEYSLFSIYFGTSWGKENSPRWGTLIVRDRRGRPIEDLGKIGLTYTALTSPVRLWLYLLNWEHLGQRNQTRLTAGRKWLAAEAHRNSFLPREEKIEELGVTPEELRDLLWKDRDRELGLGDDLTKADKAKLAGLRVNYSAEEIRELQEIVIKFRIRKEELGAEEETKMDEFASVVLRNLVNRDLHVDDSDMNFGEIFSNPLSYDEAITPDDFLTNFLVDLYRMEETIDGLIPGDESFLFQRSFEKVMSLESKRYAHLGEFPWLKTLQIDYLKQIVTRRHRAMINTELETGSSTLYEDKKNKTYDNIRAWTLAGYRAMELRELYGIDFADPLLHENGADLKVIVEKLLQVHGMRNLRDIYKGRADSWVFDIIEKVREAIEKGKEVDEAYFEGRYDFDAIGRFINRFGFNDYATFEAGIIEEPALNFWKISVREEIGTMDERLRTRDLWEAKKGQLDGDKGIYIKSPISHEELDAWERWGGARSEGGQWIEAWVAGSSKEEKWEKVGYVADEEGERVWRREAAWGDPIQRDFFDIEQRIYARNLRILSKFINDHSPLIINDPNEWLTPPQRQNLIAAHLRDIAINPDRAVQAMKDYTCTNADNWLWTVKRWTFGFIGPEFVSKIPIVGRIAKSVNVAGIGLAGPLGIVIRGALGLSPALAANPIGLITLASVLQIVSIPFFGTPLVRRLARYRAIPGTKNLNLPDHGVLGRFLGPLRLPIYWEPKGKVKEYEG